MIKKAACEHLLHVFSFLLDKYIEVQFFNFKRNYQAGLQGGHTLWHPHSWNVSPSWPRVRYQGRREGAVGVGEALARKENVITDIVLRGDNKNWTDF